MRVTELTQRAPENDTKEGTWYRYARDSLALRARRDDAARAATALS